MHCTHVPPPPQADGKKMPSFPNVVRSVDPPSTSIVFSPFMVIFTFPDDTKKDFAASSINVRASTIVKQTSIGIMIVDIVISIFFSCYISNPIKPKKAKPISPVIKNAIPTPLSGPGMCAYRILSLIAAIKTTAINQPTPEPKPYTVA